MFGIQKKGRVKVVDIRSRGFFYKERDENRGELERGWIFREGTPKRPNGANPPEVARLLSPPKKLGRRLVREPYVMASSTYLFQRNNISLGKFFQRKKKMIQKNILDLLSTSRPFNRLPSFFLKKSHSI